MSDATTSVEVDLDPEDGIIRVSRRGVCLPLTLPEAQQVICRLAGILLHKVPAGGRSVDLALVEQILYRASGVIDPRDVPALLATITAAGTTAAPPVVEPTASTRPAAPARPAPRRLGWWL